MTQKPTICILSTPNSKNSVMVGVYYRSQNEGCCLVENIVIDDKITGLKPDFVIMDDIIKWLFRLRWSVAIIADT